MSLDHNCALTTLSNVLGITEDELSFLITFMNQYSLAGLAQLAETIGSCGGGCLNQNSYNEHAVIALTNNLQNCGDYDFIWCNNLVDSPDGICPESFKLTPVGTTYTCDISKVSFKYKGAINRTMYIGDLCISVTKKRANGSNLNAGQAADLLAEAWDNAQFLTQTEFVASNHTLTSTQYKSLFILNLKISMNARFSGTVEMGAMSVINQACSGGLPIGIPKYSIFC